MCTKRDFEDSIKTEFLKKMFEEANGSGLNKPVFAKVLENINKDCASNQFHRILKNYGEKQPTLDCNLYSTQYESNDIFEEEIFYEMNIEDNEDKIFSKASSFQDCEFNGNLHKEEKKEKNPDCEKNNMLDLGNIIYTEIYKDINYESRFLDYFELNMSSLDNPVQYLTPITYGQNQSINLYIFPGVFWIRKNDCMSPMFSEVSINQITNNEPEKNKEIIYIEAIQNVITDRIINLYIECLMSGERYMFNGFKILYSDLFPTPEKTSQNKNYDCYEKEVKQNVEFNNKCRGSKKSHSILPGIENKPNLNKNPNLNTTPLYSDDPNVSVGSEIYAMDRNVNLEPQINLRVPKRSIFTKFCDFIMNCCARGDLEEIISDYNNSIQNRT